MKTKAKKNYDSGGRMDTGPESARQKVLERIRDTEDDARQQRLKLLRRDLKRADVKIYYGANNFSKYVYVHPDFSSQASRADYRATRSEEGKDILSVLWGNGPGGCYKGDYICISNVQQFVHFVDQNYGGLVLSGSERKEYFQRLLQKASGAVLEPNDACYMPDGWPEDEDDEEDE